jgi:hypothetical protein
MVMDFMPGSTAPRSDRELDAEPAPADCTVKLEVE